ncbi:MAG: hypothetical protein AAF559_07100 [Pseudomonadota bacterium]
MSGYVSVAFTAVKRDELNTLLEGEPDGPPASEPSPKIGRQRYDLATALSIVRKVETSPRRGAVYGEVKAKNTIYAFVDGLYESADKRFLQPLALFVYMLKCVLSVGPLGARKAEAVTLSNFPNEEKTIGRIAALIPDVALMRLSVSRSHLCNPRHWMGALRLIAAIGRIWPFLQTLARQHSFMPAARIASALAFYMRFTQLLADRPQLRAAIITSNYSPEAVGLAAAAHNKGRRVVYANHAPVSANGAVVPPVYADCGMFYGTRTTSAYEALSACTAEVALIGQPGTSRAMEWRCQIETIGIFLTSGTRVDVLSSLVATIRLSLPEARIIIRQHPVALLKTDFSELEIVDDKVELTYGNPLDDEIAACDMVICGNSGVAMNALSGGRPVAYLASLDSLHYDGNGFVASRLVYAMPWWSDDIYDRLKSFYQIDGWKEVMRSYDASYEGDREALHVQARAILLRHVRPAERDIAPVEKEAAPRSAVRRSAA